VNYVKNDLGENVLAVGAPGSIARVKQEYPKLISELNNLYWIAQEDYGQGIDQAVELIRNAGIKGSLETNSILEASRYGMTKEKI
jgi:hypothetical protein